MPDKTVSTTFVKAPRETVMSVIADIPAYPQWADGVKAAEVAEAGQDGLPLRVRLVVDAGFLKDRVDLLYAWQSDTRVSWELTGPSSLLSSLTGGYVLAPHQGGTEVTYELTMSLRVPIIGILRRRAEKMITDGALNGLKSQAEKLGGAT